MRALYTCCNVSGYVLVQDLQSKLGSAAALESSRPRGGDAGGSELERQAGEGSTGVSGKRAAHAG